MSRKIETPEIDSIIITERISQSSINSLIKELNKQVRVIEEFEKEVQSNFKGKFKENINIYISSYGGEVYAGLGGYDLIKSTKINTTTIALGPLMSAATLVFLGGKKRICYEHTHFMFHELTMFMWDKLENLKDDIKQGDRLMQDIENIVCTNTAITRKQFKDMCKSKKDWYISAKEAKKLRIVNEII